MTARSTRSPEPLSGRTICHMGDEMDPTELAGVADADTMSAYAWSLENEVEDVPAGSDRPFWITAAAVGVSLACVAASPLSIVAMMLRLMYGVQHQHHHLQRQST
ncbi:hypothetical protein PBI_MOZY_50 [Mycobacterium phage Mozy]|uniref:Uncharacterized protein n=1 Tax=Mycobacterium phage Mozy TaxID=2922213 RepID=G1D4G4_9CAUD|nr:hypothetical protein FGG28_gp050 [Mycobacterium phage Mozy]AEK09664.1 hypothetical protein PBI_MOZY_50 [Mycobacterium phage Mozy]